MLHSNVRRNVFAQITRPHAPAKSAAALEFAPLIHNASQIGVVFRATESNLKRVQNR